MCRLNSKRCRSSEDEAEPQAPQAVTSANTSEKCINLCSQPQLGSEIHKVNRSRALWERLMLAERGAGLLTGHNLYSHRLLRPSPHPSCQSSPPAAAGGCPFTASASSWLSLGAGCLHGADLLSLWLGEQESRRRADTCTEHLFQK